MYSIEWTKTAVKQLRGIQPPKQRMAILDAVQGLANCPTNAANVKALKRRRAGYRLRVGRYRVLFDLDDVTARLDVWRSLWLRRQSPAHS